MLSPIKHTGRWLFIIALLCNAAQAQKTNVAEESGKPAIISPSHPMDSRGEKVYETPEKGQSDEPVVPGTVLPPKPLKLPLPTYTRAMKKDKFEGDVTVEGVVAVNGDFIDAEAKGTPSPEAKDAALQAVSGYKFSPGTLDGKPVAELIRVIVRFEIHHSH